MKSNYIINHYHSIMNKNSVFILEDRGILYVSGKDAKEFLQNIISMTGKKEFMPTMNYLMIRL